MERNTSRISRLIRMMMQIKTSPHQLPASLIKSAGVSKPQFYKDKEELERIGFSFRYDRSQRRFVIENDPHIPVYDLTLTETFALVMAVRQLSATGDFILTYDALNAIRKIVSGSPQAQREFLCSSLDDVVLKEGFGCDSEILSDLQKAIMEGRRISILYDLYSEGSQKEYTLDPYQIYFKRRALYLDAYSIEDKDYRVYRVNRIKQVGLLPMLVPRRPDYSFAHRHRDSFSVFVSDKIEKVKIKFGKRIAPYIQETCWHLSQKITKQKDGTIIFEVEVSEPREVGWWVMQWGEEAEVLEPQSLREVIASTIQKMTRIYSGEFPKNAEV